MLILDKEFHSIPGFPNHLISKDGEVFSLHRRRILKGGKDPAGYRLFVLDGTMKRLHVLIGLAFIPNPENKREINHKDLDKSNNTIDNLEWCTRKENQQHAADNGRLGGGRMNIGRKCSEATKNIMSIKKLGRNHPKYKGDYITPAGQFGSSSEAAAANGVANKTIIRRCNDLKWLYLGWSMDNKQGEYNRRVMFIRQREDERRPKTTLTHITLMNGRTIKL